MSNTYQFVYQNQTYSLKLEPDNEYISPDNDLDVLEIFWKYKQEQEEIAFKNAPPETFHFFRVSIEESEPQLVGACSPEKAIELVSRIFTPIKVESSYEKHCNFAALSEEESTAQCYDVITYNW